MKPSTVLAVLVLFRKQLFDVPCLNQLVAWQTEKAAGGGLSLSHVLIYDNSPQASDSRCLLPSATTMIHDPQNGGTRAAYHAALKQAVSLNCDWILLLDHDTTLPQDFLESSHSALCRYPSWQHVGAVLPTVYVNGAIASPSLITPYGRTTSFRGKSERSGGEVTGIASGALISAAHLSAIAPIPNAFALDYLDHWLFRALQRAGSHIVLSGVHLNHALSVHAMHAMSTARYESILNAEHRFLREMPSYSRVRYLAWHSLRTFNMLVRNRRWALTIACLRHVRSIAAGR